MTPSLHCEFMGILYVFNNWSLISRIICDRSPENDLSAKMTWQNGTTQSAVFCHLVSRWKSASCYQILFIEIKRHLVINFKYTWFIQMKQIFVRIPNDKILLPFCFQRSKFYSATGCRICAMLVTSSRMNKILSHIHNIMMNVLEIMGICRRRIKNNDTFL